MFVDVPNQVSWRNTVSVPLKRLTAPETGLFTSGRAGTERTDYNLMTTTQKRVPNGAKGCQRGPKVTKGNPVLTAATFLKARVYYSDSVICNPTPLPRRPLEPSKFSVGMSDTRRNSPPDGYDMLTTNHGNSVGN